MNPAKKANMTIIWDEFYRAVREDADYPTTLDQSVEVMRVVSAAKEGTQFE